MGYSRTGGIAALLYGVLSLSALVIAIGFIGYPAIVDNEALSELAINNPSPLIAQDYLKIITAATSIVLITAMYSLYRQESPKLIYTGSLFGVIAAVFLFTNAILSLYAISQASNFTLQSSESIQLIRLIIVVLAILVVVLNGVWYLAINWTALKSGKLPTLLSYLGILIGVISMLPPLGILVLILSVFWSVWLGITLLGSN